MGIKPVFSLFIIALLTLSARGATINSQSEFICGKWESTEKNLIVQVYMQDGKFEAKIVWFKETNEKPIDTWKDIHNPDKLLQNRKILGMSVLRDLTYQADTNSWENGMIYDAMHGREWNASAYIDKNGLLKVKGYWHFKFIGHTLTFTRL
jgi:uncharacterized protein (DUF2147 family)